MTDDRRALRTYAVLASLAGALALLAFVVAATRLDVSRSSGPLEACQTLLASPDILGAACLGTLLLAMAAAGRATWRASRMIRRARQRQAARPVVGRAGDALVVDGPHVEAYCAGIVRPRIYVTTAAVQKLGQRELAAVVAHERHHALRRDPLRLVIVRALADALFFLPSLRRLGRRYGELAELAADDAAIQATGDRAALASALLAFDDDRGIGTDAMPERVDHLCGDRARWRASLSMLGGSLATLATAGALITLLAAQAGPASVPLFEVAAHASLLIVLAALVTAGMTWLARRARLRRLIG